MEKQKGLAKELFELEDTSQLDQTVGEPKDRETVVKARNFDRLLDLMKEKLSDKSLTTSQRIQFFSCSEYQVCEARVFVEEKGILAIPEAKLGRSISQEDIGQGFGQVIL